MKFENTEVFNFEGAFRGMRNPMNSWNKSDSERKYESWHDMSGGRYIIGKNDLKLAQRLIGSGNEHAKFLRQIFVSVDITAPLFWWSEADTYKIGTTANSCSTIHKLVSRDLIEEDFEVCRTNLEYRFLLDAITNLNKCRNDTYMTDKEKLIAMKTLLPTSYLQKRTWSANYAVLRNMYFQRQNHRLEQWSKDFIEWIKSLPYTNELIMYNNIIGKEVML